MMKVKKQDNQRGKFCCFCNGLKERWEVWSVLIFAFFYYVSYYRNGLNLGGEGGTAGVIALRLLEGQRPIVDTFLGYNVFWFYPIAGLFQIFGPNFLVLKIFFFVLCTVTALLATFFVRKTTGSSVLAAGTGLLLVLIPGMQFRNYLPFLGVLNMVTLSQAFIFSRQEKRGIRMAIAGLALGLTYLIRIDVGLLITFLILALFFVFPWSTELGPRRGLKMVCGGAVIIAIFAIIPHIPVLWDAHRRGFEQQFLNQYCGWSQYIKSRATTLFNEGLHKIKSAPGEIAESVREDQPESLQSSAIAPPPQAIAHSSQKESKAILSKPSVSDLFQHKSVRRTFAWAIYFPVPISILIFFGMGTLWLVTALQRNFEECQRTLGILVAWGCALTLFPQYFFFRPDTPHLSEFMVPFTVLMVLACWQAVRIAQLKSNILAWGYAIILLLFCATDVVAHLSNGLRRESSGSIAARRNQGTEFVASNGVRVLVQANDFSDLQGIYSTIMKHSTPNDWVVCYPYASTINFMTNRRSYEYNLYVDNATKGKNFDSETIKKIVSFKPAVVVIDNRPINQNEASHFKNWAAPTYEYIRSHYNLAGVYGPMEIYVQKNNQLVPRK